MMGGITDLPVEVLDTVFRYCSTESLISLRAVATVFKEIADSGGRVKCSLKSRDFSNSSFRLYFDNSRKLTVTIADILNHKYNGLGFALSCLRDVSLYAFPSNSSEELSYFHSKLDAVLMPLESEVEDVKLESLSMNCLVAHWADFDRFIDRINASTLDFSVKTNIYLSLAPGPLLPEYPILLSRKFQDVTFCFTDFIDFPSTLFQLGPLSGDKFFSMFEFSQDSQLRRLLLLNEKSHSVPVLNPAHLSKFLSPCRQLEEIELDSIDLKGNVDNTVDWFPSSLQMLSFAYSGLYVTSSYQPSKQFRPNCNVHRIDTTGLRKIIGDDQYISLFEHVNFPNLTELNLDMDLQIHSSLFLTNVLGTLKSLNLYLADWDVLDTKINDAFKTSPLTNLFIEVQSGTLDSEKMNYIKNLRNLESLTLVLNVDLATCSRDNINTTFGMFLKDLLSNCRHIQDVKVGNDVTPCLNLPITSVDRFSIANLDLSAYKNPNTLIT
ncbi:hypothetical protein TRICI_004411 [Trichomonascus ciferrii]|uniref:F-box domain-containing protein n=1 Tax=Trichomonascus ciferrii TaxID=44093 RepID=A0A642V7B8_9ASCO|nr:hypothetical protein TRICI_004411 [Trichomonascus ciferrii]